MVMSEQKSIFVTFGAGRSGWIGAAKRITAEANKTGLFDFCFNLDEQWLQTWDPEIYEIGLKLRKSHPSRGFGYWTWKPSVLLWARLNFPNHQIVYVDAGSQISHTNSFELQKLLLKVKQNGQLAWFLPNHPEFHWTKSELLRKLKLPVSILNTAQVQSGFIAFESSATRIEFFTEFRNFAVMEEGFFFSDLIKLSQDLKFKEHRHDQSVFSCLWKLEDYYSEEDPSFPNQNNNFPLIAYRNNSRLAMGKNSIVRKSFKYTYLLLDRIKNKPL
jgi:hypothetical protein